MKNKTNLLRIALVLATIILVLYFFKDANDWENVISRDWSRDPLLSNASASFEYLRALVKITITGIIAIVSMQYLNHKD